MCVRDTTRLSETPTVPFIDVTTTPSATLPIQNAKPPAYDSIFPPSPPLSASSPSSSPSNSFFSTVRGRRGTAYGGLAAKSSAAPCLLSSPPLSPAAEDTFAKAFVLPSLLEQVFPVEAPIHAQASEEVPLDDLLGEGWTGAIVEDALAGTRALYVGGGKVANGIDLRDAVVEIVDRAESEHECQSLVLCLDKGMAGLAALVHQLAYVGATVVTAHDHTGAPNDNFLLLGLEI